MTEKKRSFIKIDGLSKKFERGSEGITLFKKLSIEITQGGFVVFMGPSGSGKTTLLNLLGGLDKPSSGSIKIDGQEISKMSMNELTEWRSQHVGFVFQMFNLIPVLTAYENVEIPLLLTDLPKKKRREHVEYALKLVGLQDRMKHYPRHLSGGEIQRVAIARAFINDPPILLCDEPTGNLDRKNADEILELLRKLSVEQGKSVLVVTHDPLAAKAADIVYHLEKGIFMPQKEGGGV